MTSNTSRRKCQSSVRPKRWGRRGHMNWMHHVTQLWRAGSLGVVWVKVPKTATTLEHYYYYYHYPRTWSFLVAEAVSFLLHSAASMLPFHLCKTPSCCIPALHNKQWRFIATMLFRDPILRLYLLVTANISDHTMPHYYGIIIGPFLNSRFMVNLKMADKTVNYVHIHTPTLYDYNI